MERHSIYKTIKLWTTAGLAILLLTCLGITQSSAESKCEFPNEIVLGKQENMLLFKTEEDRSRARLLDELDVWTKGKWIWSLIFPKLWAGEVGIHLYPWDEAHFLTQYEDVDTTDAVRFFIGCKFNDLYKIIPGTLSRINDRAVFDREIARDWNGYLGMTFSPEGTKPKTTLKGSLHAFRIKNYGKELTEGRRWNGSSAPMVILP